MLHAELPNVDNGTCLAAELNVSWTRTSALYVSVHHIQFTLIILSRFLCRPISVSSIKQMYDVLIQNIFESVKKMYLMWHLSNGKAI